MPGPVADVAAITIAATVGTAPLMAFHFQQVSLAALPANLLAAAAIAPVMWLGMLAATAAQLAPAFAAPFNAANAPLLGFVQWVADTMAAAPAAVVPLRLSSPAALAAAYGVLASAILAIRVAWRRASAARGWALDAVSSPDGRWTWAASGPLPLDGPSRSWPARRRLVAAAVAVPVLVLVLATATGGDILTPPARGELVVSFLDVGQGDATLLQKDGVAVLVDTGPPGGPILRRLDEAGVKRLDALVITHAQSDHEGAALTVLREVPVRMIVNGGAGWPTAVQDGLPQATGVARRVAAHAGQVLTLGGIRMRLLWPPPPEPDFRPEGDPNDRALVATCRSVTSTCSCLPTLSRTSPPRSRCPRSRRSRSPTTAAPTTGSRPCSTRTDPEFAAIEVGARQHLRSSRALDPRPRSAPSRTSDRTDREGTIRAGCISVAGA